MLRVRPWLSVHQHARLYHDGGFLRRESARKCVVLQRWYTVPQTQDVMVRMTHILVCLCARTCMCVCVWLTCHILECRPCHPEVYPTRFPSECPDRQGTSLVCPALPQRPRNDSRPSWPPLTECHGFHDGSGAGWLSRGWNNEQWNMFRSVRTDCWRLYVLFFGC